MWPKRPDDVADVRPCRPRRRDLLLVDEPVGEVQRRGLRLELLQRARERAAERLASVLPFTLYSCAGPRLCAASWSTVLMSCGSRIGRVLRHRVLAEQRLGLLLRAPRCCRGRCRGSSSRRCGRGPRSRPGPSSAATGRWSRRAAARESPALSTMSMKSGSWKLTSRALYGAPASSASAFSISAFSGSSFSATRASPG